MQARRGPHGSPGDAKHRPETALTRLLTMRGLHNQCGTTAVASISTRAAFSTRRTTCTSAIAG